VIFELTHMILVLYSWILVIAVFISWVNADPYNTIVRFIRNITEPVLAPIRRKLLRLTYKTGLDFSPLVALIVIIFIDRVIVRVLLPIAIRLEHGG